MMKCENKFCIYQSQGECGVEDVEIDMLGICATFIHIPIDDDALDKAKREMLEILDRRDREFALLELE